MIISKIRIRKFTIKYNVLKCFNSKNINTCKLSKDVAYVMSIKFISYYMKY